MQGERVSGVHRDENGAERIVMRWRKYIIGAATIAVLLATGVVARQYLAEREARARFDAWVQRPPAPFTAFKYGDKEDA